MGELCLPPPLYARPGYKQGLSPRQALVLLFALLHFHEAGEACTLTTVYESYVRDLLPFLMGLIESTKSRYRPISIIKLHTLLHFHR